MTEPTVEVVTTADGSVVIHQHGTENAVELRHTLVHVVRRLRPQRLILDLQHVHDLDSITVGTLAAACALGDDHLVTVFIDNSPPVVADRLAAAGIAGDRLRHVRTDRPVLDSVGS